MTRLTDPLLKTKSARNPQKNLKKFIDYNIQSYQNHKIRRPNALGNCVSPQSMQKPEAACRDEMLLMMSCWKRTEFREKSCTEEYNNFAKCMSQVRVKAVKEQVFEDTAEFGRVSEDGKMNTKQINKLLRMYPQPPFKITLTHGAGFQQPKPIVFKQDSEDNSQRSIPRHLWGKPGRQNKSS